MQGKYKAANHHFRKALAIDLAQTNCASIATATSTRVLYGIGHGHEMMWRVRDHIRVATEPCVEQMLDWKDNRRDNFELRIPAESKLNQSWLQRNHVAGIETGFKGMGPNKY